jgi:hypothetical protein
VTERLVFDVFGARMEVERAADGWRLWRLGTDGKRSPVDVSIPAFVAQEELLQYLDDVFHEVATPEHPSVRRVTRYD